MTAERTYAGRPVSDRAAERRRRFLDAALAEFSSTGYAKSSVTSICRTAGLSRRPVSYTHLTLPTNREV